MTVDDDVLRAGPTPREAMAGFRTLARMLAVGGVAGAIIGSVVLLVVAGVAGGPLGEIVVGALALTVPVGLVAGMVTQLVGYGALLAARRVRPQLTVRARRGVVITVAVLGSLTTVNLVPLWWGLADFLLALATAGVATLVVGLGAAPWCLHELPWPRPLNT